MVKSNKLLHQKIRATDSVEEKIKCLTNRWNDETCYIITCGPSLKQVWSQKMHEFLSNKNVIAVKQAARLVGDIASIHLVNQCNMEAYSLPKETIKISMIHKDFECGYEADIVFPRKYLDLSGQIFNGKNIADYMFGKTLNRPSPGIMTEVGMFLPLLMGCSKSVVIGWDLNPKNKRHFYSSKPPNQIDEYQKLIKLSPSIAQMYMDCGSKICLYSPLNALKIRQIDEKEFYEG